METLDKFFNGENPDGHYAVWKSKWISTPNDVSLSDRLYGFSGAVVEYTNREGFKNCPQWMDDTPEEEIKIILLEELPSVEMFS